MHSWQLGREQEQGGNFPDGALLATPSIFQHWIGSMRGSQGLVGNLLLGPACMAEHSPATGSATHWRPKRYHAIHASPPALVPWLHLCTDSDSANMGLPSSDNGYGGCCIIQNSHTCASGPSCPSFLSMQWKHTINSAHESQLVGAGGNNATWRMHLLQRTWMERGTFVAVMPWETFPSALLSQVSSFMPSCSKDAVVVCLWGVLRQIAYQETVKTSVSKLVSQCLYWDVSF